MTCIIWKKSNGVIYDHKWSFFGLIEMDLYILDVRSAHLQQRNHVKLRKNANVGHFVIVMAMNVTVKLHGVYSTLHNVSRNIVQSETEGFFSFPLILFAVQHLS